MASDPDKPLLRLLPLPARDRLVGRPRSIPRPEAFPPDRQRVAFAPKFDRLADVLMRDPSGLELRSDPAALAPERLLVFEVRGAIGPFAAAVRRVPGLELVDEEELEADGDKAPVAYLMIPDLRALRELEGLWRRWVAGRLGTGETPWRDVFALLRDLRPWGPGDRVQSSDAGILEEEIAGRAPGELVRLEVELVHRSDDAVASERDGEVRRAIEMAGGRTVSAARIPEIAYHALLADLPAAAVQDVIDRNPTGIAGLDPVMHIRPQAVASSVEVAEGDAGDGPAVAGDPLGEPVLALLDGVPVAAHRLLAAHLVVDDRFSLEPGTPVAQRVHGTAMASLIVHGDRNRSEPPLPRRVHAVPVLAAEDAFPSDRLIVDMIYVAVSAMREGPEPTAPGVVIVNLSLGNPRRPFHGRLSAWARLLDRLAHRHGILFVVSAGNHRDRFGIRAFPGHLAFQDADPGFRARETLRALGEIVADRRLLSPAETVNGLTIGASNEDAVGVADRATARVNVDPYGARRICNPSSALGPGFALSVKPDVLLPGSREMLRVVDTSPHVVVAPAGPMRAAGLRVAAPPRNGLENRDGYTNGTSAAAALASRTAHRIHDALELAYGSEFLALPHAQRAVLLKALLAHTAKWPDATAGLIRDVIGPPDGRQHVRQKDNIRRFIGFGIIEPEDAVACAADRATFWATGVLEPDKVATIEVPVPIAMGGQARPHAFIATLAWFTPTSPGRRSYRSVRLRLLEPDALEELGVRADGDQPDGNQTNRGTLYMRRWTGRRAAAVSAAASVTVMVQRDPDQGPAIDDPVPFGLAVTLSMPGEVRLYEQVRARLGVVVRATV